MLSDYDNPLLAAWLLLAHSKGLKLSTVLRLKGRVSCVTELFAMRRQALLRLGMLPKVVDSLCNPDWRWLDQELTYQEKNQVHAIAYDSPDYPPLLKEISTAPMVLMAKGDIRLLQYPQLAVVGARKSSEYGSKHSFSFAKLLTQAGWIITSGLALGIDGYAHQGALAAGGPTIAVIGTGLGHCYPRQHQALAEKIMDNGVIVTEFFHATPPKAQNFPRRNRIISGLAKGVLVVEAALKSGSLITARLALEQNREIFAIPGPIDNQGLVGSHALINQGAKLVTNVLDILEELPHIERRVETKETENKSLNQNDSENFLNENYQRVYDCISDSMTPVDEVIAKTGLQSKNIISILMILELRRYIIAVPGGYIRAKELQYERTSA